jgi:hypothetical protein
VVNIVVFLNIRARISGSIRVVAIGIVAHIARLRLAGFDRVVSIAEAIAVRIQVV